MSILPLRPSRPPLAVRRFSQNLAVTLAEVMVAMTLMSTMMLGVMGSFIKSRQITEASILHSASTSLIYGIIDQIKHLDYSTSTPSVGDPDAPHPTNPFVQVSINQDTKIWIPVVYTPAPIRTPATPNPTPIPRAPTARPSPSATALSLNAIEYELPPIPLSTAAGTSSQQIKCKFWIWIDEIPDWNLDAREVKKITIVYTYEFNSGSGVQTKRDWEVILHTRYQ